MNLFEKATEVLLQIYENIIDMMMQDGTLVSREAAQVNFLFFSLFIMVIVALSRDIIYQLGKGGMIIFKFILKWSLKKIRKGLHWGIQAIDQNLILKWNHSKIRRMSIYKLRNILNVPEQAKRKNPT